MKTPTIFLLLFCLLGTLACVSETPDGDDRTQNDTTDEAPLSLPPLQPGFYVMEGTDCDNPANAAWRYWTGEGLRGSATESCRLEVTERQGDTYRVTQSCVNTYDRSRTSTDFTITVNDKTSFTIGGTSPDQKFTRCTEPPSWYTDNTDASEYLSALQGTWKRQSYPYGEIIFEEDRVKFATGEGLPEPAEFQPYRIDRTCPDRELFSVSAEAYDFALVTRSEYCDAIDLDGDSFTIYFGGAESGVEYERVK